MAQTVTNIEFSAGFITITFGSGPPAKFAIKDMLREADIPVLTLTQLTLLTRFSDLFMIILKTHLERKTLDEDYEDDYDLDYIISELAVLGSEF